LTSTALEQPPAALASHPSDTVNSAMGDQRSVALTISLNERRVTSETICQWAGPYVLVIATTLPDLGIELHSSFLGHEGSTCSTHLVLGPTGHDPLIVTDEHSHGPDPVLGARACVYEHHNTLLEALKGLHYRVALDVPDDAFELLERA